MFVRFILYHIKQEKNYDAMREEMSQTESGLQQ